MSELMVYAQIAGLVLLALAAAGAVLFLKLARRREPPVDGDLDAAPAPQISEERAAILRRRYWSAVAGVIALLLIAGAAVGH